MAIDEVGDRPADVGGAFGFATQAVDTLTGEFANAGKFDRTDIHDPAEFGDYKRGKIESEHQGLRGLVGSAYSGLGLQPSYQSEMDTLTDAETYAHAGDTKAAADSDAQKSRMGLQQLRSQMDATVSDLDKTDYQRQQEAIDANATQQIAAANSIANDKTFYSQGFRSQAEANAYAEHLKRDAEAVHDSQSDKLIAGRYDQMQSGQERLEVLQRTVAGDKIGGARAALESKLNAEERGIDPKDTERVNQFEKISQQSLVNFDADAGKIERDAFPQELHRTPMSNAQASALSGASQSANSNLNSLHDSGASNLGDAVRKLETTTTKLDKALAASTTLVLVKD